MSFTTAAGGDGVRLQAGSAVQFNEGPTRIKRKSSVPTVEADREFDSLASHAHSVSLPPVIRVALERRKLIGITALVIVALTLMVILLLPNRYTASIVILPPQQAASAGAAMMAQLSSMGAMASAGGMGIKNPNDLQVALLKSRTVEDAMIERFALQSLYHRKYLSTTRKRWERDTLIDNGIKDGLIRLSVTDEDPRRAAELANGWVEEYRRFTATLAVSEASQRRLFFERQLGIAREDLARAEEELKQTEQRTGVIELDGQAHAMIAAAAILRAQVAAKEVEIQAMRQFAANENPDLERTQKELSSLEGQLAAMDVDSDRQSGDLVAPKGKLGDAGLEYARALREVKYREAVQDLLTRQLAGAQLDEARQGSLVQIVDAAAVPDRPDSLYKIWIVVTALLLSLPAALLIALGAEVFALVGNYRRRTSSWAEALEEAWTEGVQ
ncbi:MAG: Wzz/FepE/Etk N-terminal domain-containing protein [Terracidiphilus sp.]